MSGFLQKRGTSPRELHKLNLHIAGKKGKFEAEVRSVMAYL